MTCENCGASMPDTATFCTTCGWKTSEWKKETKKTKANKKMGIVAIILWLILIALILLTIFANI